MDNDFNEGVEDILPPLPSTPQQTLFSFFKKSQDLNKESRNKESKNHPFKKIQATLKKLPKHNESHQSLPLNKETSSNIVNENIQNEVNSTSKEILNIDNDFVFLNEADIKSKSKTKLNKKNEAVNEEEPSDDKDFTASFSCRDAVKIGTSQLSLPTPFPVYNHVNCDLVHHEPIKRFLNEESNADKICDFPKITDDYKSLLDKQIKKKSFVDGSGVQAKKTEFRLVEDWLLILVEQYPDFPVKKFFQHFLSCQKSIITKNIQRNEAMINNLKSIWERDAEVQMINSVLDDHKNKELLEKNHLKKKSDVKDIRFLLKKSVKKKNPSERLSKYETKNPQKVEEAEVANNSIIDVEHLKETDISHCDIKSIGIIHPNKQEQTSPLKINISINGLLGNAIQKREQRKEKQNRRRDFFNCENLSKDINEVFKEKVCELINEKNVMQENILCTNSDVVKEDSDILVQKNPNKLNVVTEDYSKVVSKDVKAEKRVNSKDIRAMFSNVKDDSEDSIIEIKTSAPRLEVNFQEDSIDQKVYTNLLNNIDNKLSLNVDPVSLPNGSISDVKIESEKQEAGIQQHFVDNKKGSKRKNFLSNKDSNKKYKCENSGEKMSNKVDLVSQSDDQRHLCEHSILVDSLIENNTLDSPDCLYVTGTRKEEEISSEKIAKVNVRRSSRNKRKVDYSENFVSPLKIDTKSEMLAKSSSKPVLGSCSKVLQNCIVEEKDFTNDPDLPMDDERTESSLKKKPAHSKFNERSPKLKPALELVLNEVVVNSFLSWTEKYQPNKPRFVLGDRAKVRELFDWLNTWKEHHDLVAKKKALKASKKKKESDSDSDSDLSFSEDEFSLSNTLLLTGPVGCGTTAAVVACAKQMQFKVLEINSSILRTGKQVLDRVAEAVVSHQIKKKQPTASKAAFFTCKQADKPETVEDDEMSLVLFEHVDIVYEDHDKGFWQGLNSLRQLSKRPIILTANDLSKAIFDDKEGVCMQSISLERPPTEQLLPMMQIICLIEHVFVPKEFLQEIIRFCNNDVRKTMLQLQFWLEQGKEPMYKLWKERQQNKSNINAIITSPSETSSNSLVKLKTQCNNNNMQTNSPIVTKDISLVDNFEKVHQPNTDPLKILIPCVNLTNFLKNSSEDFFNIETISACNLWSNQSKNSHHSFIKKINQKADGDTSLQNLSNIIDCISEMDCFLHSRYDYKEKDIYPWSASLTDSLVDFLTIEIDISPPYPIKVMLDSAKSVVENCYRRCHETDKLVFIQQRNNSEELAFQKRIKSVMPLSSEHRHFNQDVLPFLRNMCLSEEQKRIVQSRRKNRRFLHYLDTISLCLDEKILKKLATSPFSVS